MEMPGTEVTHALVGELAAATEPKQILLLHALGARGDATAAPAMAPLAQSGPVERRIAALRGILQLASPSSLPMALATLVQDPDAAISSEALAAMTAFPGKETDAALLALLDGAAPKLRIAVIQAIGQWRMAAAMPVLAEKKPLPRMPVWLTPLSRCSAISKEEKMTISLPSSTARTLSGWNGKPGWWTVEDGALTAESTPEKPCKECNYLIWRGGQPADFELLADFKLSSGANSGIQIRSEERPNWDTFGYQADMTGDGALVGFVYHHHRGLIAGRGERPDFAADGNQDRRADR